MTSPRSTLAACILAAAVALAGAPAALAAEPPDDIPDGMGWDVSAGKLVDPFEVDAARFAKAFDRDYDEQLTQLRAIVALDKPLAALEKDEDFGGSYWASVDELVVMYKGGTPKSTLTALRAASPVKVTPKTVPYSLVDLEHIRDTAVAEVKAAGVSGEDIVSGLDPKGQEVLVSVRASSSQTKDAVRSGVSSRTPEGATRLAFTTKPVALPKADVYSGSELLWGGGTNCTTAFTVKNSNNVKGALSAKHCGTGDTFYDWEEQVTDSSPVYKGQHYGGWGDMRWLTTSHNEKDDYYWNNDGDRRDIEYVKNNYSIGDPVAGYGRGDDEQDENHNGPNGWTGSVKFIRVQWGSLDRMVCIGWFGTEGGDSGGPYFNGTVAVGITFGGLWKNGKYRDCFSQTRYVDNALGVTIHK